MLHPNVYAWIEENGPWPFRAAATMKAATEAATEDNVAPNSAPAASTAAASAPATLVFSALGIYAQGQPSADDEPPTLPPSPPAIRDIAEDWHADAWLDEFSAASGNAATARLRRGKLLSSVARDTVRVCAAGEYRFEHDAVKLPQHAGTTTVHTSDVDAISKPAVQNEASCATVRVMSIDCIDAAVALVGEGFDPALLNMANQAAAGGGWKTGAAAQEEDLFRRSNLHQLIDQQHYPLPEFGCTHAPGSVYFRRGASAGYAYLPTPVRIATISCAAYVQPATRGARLAAAQEEGTRRKIDAVFAAALANGHDSLVLSALGCGAFGNPPSAIARLFKEACTRYAKAFRRIDFAVIDDEAARVNGTSNFAAFEREFKNFNNA